MLVIISRDKLHELDCAIDKSLITNAPIQLKTASETFLFNFETIFIINSLFAAYNLSPSQGGVLGKASYNVNQMGRYCSPLPICLNNALGRTDVLFASKKTLWVKLPNIRQLKCGHCVLGIIITIRRGCSVRLL